MSACSVAFMKPSFAIPFAKKGSTSRKSILGVDDDFDIVSVMKSGLQKYSAFNVYGFTESALALEHFEINVKNYDLLISDIRMPQMNGFEFIKKS